MTPVAPRSSGVGRPDYASFLASKIRSAPDVGRSVNTADVHPMLHDWQAEIYWRQAVAHLRRAEETVHAPSLFDEAS